MAKKYDLTVIVPGIRRENWHKLYDSVARSFKGRWEIIFISPYGLPATLREPETMHNIKWIQDNGSPTRCQQLGLIASDGEYINWAADDGVFLPGAMDIGFEKIRQSVKENGGAKYKSVVMGKYIEGNNDGDMPMTKDAYYNLKNHDGSRLRNLPGDVYWMLNVGLVARSLLLSVGGWDCQFEVLPMAFNDMAIRLQNMGVEFIIQDEIMFQCGHIPGTTGDHAPVHYAQIEHDQPLFARVYQDPNCSNRVNIKLNNHENSPRMWARRFRK